MKTARGEIITRLQTGLCAAGKTGAEAETLALSALVEAEGRITQAMKAEPKMPFKALPAALAALEVWARDVLAAR